MSKTIIILLGFILYSICCLIIYYAILSQSFDSRAEIMQAVKELAKN